MKLREFRAPRPIVAKLIDGTELPCKYLPRFMTSANLEAYNAFAEGQGDHTAEEYADIAAKYLSTALTWIDIQDDDGSDIEPTYDNLKLMDLDFPTVRAINTAIFQDIGERGNFTPKAEGGSSTGSTAKDEETPTS